MFQSQNQKDFQNSLHQNEIIDLYKKEHNKNSFALMFCYSCS